MEYVSNLLRKFKPFLNIAIFLVLFTLCFFIVVGTLKYTIPFIVGLIAASILKKPTEWLIDKFQIKSNLSAIISTLVFYAITVTLLVLGVVFFCSEIKDLATDGYNYIYNNGGKIGILIQDSLSKFKGIDEAVIEALKSNVTSYISDISNYVLEFSKGMVNYIINFISVLPYIVSVIVFAILSSFIFLKKFIEKSPNENSESKHFENRDYDRYMKIIVEIKEVVFKYIGTYSILVFCTFIITFIGFNIVKIPYTLLLSLICMFLDILPVVGMVLVFLPLMIIYLFQGKYFIVIFLIGLFAFIMITRNILEPKLLSSSLEISPLSVLIAIFVGLNFAGFKGMIYLMALFISFNFYRKYSNRSINEILKDNKESANQ